jgi:site-specific recombinase XerD
LIGYRKKNGAASRAKRLVTIRTFFRYLYREGLLRRDPAVFISIRGLRLTQKAVGSIVDRCAASEGFHKSSSLLYQFCGGNSKS